MKLFSKEVKIGLTGVIALCLLIYGINYLKGIEMFKPTNYFYVKFKNVNGLTKSSPVFADGYRVGIVSDLHYDYTQPGNVIAEIDIDPELRIPKGSTAELETDLLGAMKLSILLSNNPRERYEAGDTLTGFINNGAMGAVAEMVPSIEKMLPKLDSILSSLNTLLANPALPATLNNVQELTAHLNTTSQHLENMMGKEIPELTGKLNTLSDNFITISDNLKQIDYAEAMRRVDETLANVKKITDNLTDTNNSVGLLLNDPTLYQNLTETTQNAADLLEDLKAHPKRYVHFSIFGKKDK